MNITFNKTHREVTIEAKWSKNNAWYKAQIYANDYGSVSTRITTSGNLLPAHDVAYLHDMVTRAQSHVTTYTR